MAVLAHRECRVQQVGRSGPQLFNNERMESMGYTTSFDGELKIDRPVDAETEKQIRAIYYADDTEIEGFPRGYCQWELQEDMQSIKWDGNEKFYYYVEWLEALVSKILEPNGYKLNGEMLWSGQDAKDVGTITVIDNAVVAKAWNGRSEGGSHD